MFAWFVLLLLPCTRLDTSLTSHATQQRGRQQRESQNSVKAHPAVEVSLPDGSGSFPG